MTGRTTVWRALRTFSRAKTGVSAVEFALIAPVMVLMMAGFIDIGLTIFKRIEINSAISSASQRLFTSEQPISASNVDQTAQSLAAILLSIDSNDQSPNHFTLSFNGARDYRFVGSNGTVAGSATALDSCRCPTRSEGAIAWGGAIDCDTTCPDNSIAGKYASIEFTQPNRAIFSYFGFVDERGTSIKTLMMVP